MVPPGDNSYSLFLALVKQEKRNLYVYTIPSRVTPPKKPESPALITCPKEHGVLYTKNKKQ